MAISFVGSATGVNTATMPSHQAGDLLVVFAYSETVAVAPTQPAGWTSINTGSGNSNGHIVSRKLAASNSEVVGTWTNANELVVHVYRGVDQTTPIGANAQFTNVVDVQYPALTLQKTDGTSWVAAIGGRRTGNNPDAVVPPGTVLRSDTGVSATGRILGYDTNGGVASWPLLSTGGTNTFRYRSASIEIRAAAGSDPAITGTLSVNEDPDSIAATGQVKIAGTLAVTEAADTSSGTGALRIAGSVTIAEAGDNIVAAGSLRISGAATITEQGDLTAATGVSAAAIITGSITITEASDAVVSSGTLRISGASAQTEGADVVAGLGSLRVQGAGIANEQDDVLAFAGKLKIAGSITLAEDADTVFASGALVMFPIIGAIVIAEAPDQVEAVGLVNGITPPIPVDRIRVVPASNRTFAVPASERSYNVR